MKNLLAILTVTVTLIPAASFAAEFDDEQTINDRSEASIIASLAENGIDAERVEEWGTAIRVDGRNPDGSNYFILVDKDTLQPRQPASGVATQLSVRPTGSGWSAESFSSNRSLVE